MDPDGKLYEMINMNVEEQSNMASSLSVPSLSSSALFTSSSLPTILLDGLHLTPQLLYDIGFHFRKVGMTLASKKGVVESRKIIDKVIRDKRVVYGINTGFGLFSNKNIGEADLEKLQYNLIRSHACGVGPYLSLQRTRMLLALRINILCLGHSGIKLSTLLFLISALNLNCISCVPIKGTVGASGDLAPLAHLALGLLGEGDMWHHNHSLNMNSGSFHKNNILDYKPMPAASVLKMHALEPLTLAAKEGLALINGTQFIASLGCEAVLRCMKLAICTDIVAALSLEALKGTPRAYSELIHLSRPHKGQLLSASILRSLLHNSDLYKSEIFESHSNCGKVQDAYTLRCAPQVHGIVHDTIAFVFSILSTEINSATDNPMIFANAVKREDEIISGGNFHAEYPAKVLDYLAIAIAELGNMSERRIERLNNPDLSGLNPFLVDSEPGLNSGFMIAHVTAAALVSENKVLCHPSSVDSLSTSGAKEDHVSMGGFSARKALMVVENVETIIAIELMCACQGIDLLRPLKSTEPLEKLHALVRKHVPMLKEDRFMKPDIDKMIWLVQTNQIWDVVKPFIPKKYKNMHNMAKL